jgi:hypothetical protein
VYLIVDEGGPEAGGGAAVGVGGEDRRARAGEDLVEVLNDDLRLGDRLAVVDEHGNFLVHRVGLEKELALVEEVLLDVLVAEALEVEHDLDPVDVRAVPHAQQLQLTSIGRHFCQATKLDRWFYSGCFAGDAVASGAY